MTLASEQLTPVFTNFTDGKPHVITEACLEMKHAPASWCRCALCGHKGKVGDVFVWVYTNDRSGPQGNPFVCIHCYGDDVRAKLLEMDAEWRKIKRQFWWFCRRRDQ